MNITIASGKGGTGKTTVTVNLAAVMEHGAVRVYDCDVEEPNAHLFVRPENVSSREVATMIPKVDTDRCSRCGTCEALCQFSAITLVGDQIMTFPEMCHSCRGCEMICPEDAVSAGERVLGQVHQGVGIGGIHLTWGELRVGEAMSPPLIEKVKALMVPENLSLVDAPPGTSCPAIAALRDADYALLVAEPTPFGCNDLDLTVSALRKLGVPMGIVINRADPEPGIIDDYAREQEIEILQRFPFSREAAAACSGGHLLVEKMPDMKQRFEELAEALQQRLAPAAELEVTS